MPTNYRPIKLTSGIEQQIKEAAGIEAKLEILVARLAALEDQLNVELRRVSTSLNGAGGDKASVRRLSADANLSSTDGTVLVDTTAGAVTVTLPFAREYPGMRIYVRRDAGTNNATLAARSGDTVLGGSTASANGGVRVQSDGLTKWFSA